MNNKFIRRLPEGRWFEKHEIADYSKKDDAYIDSLVSRAYLARQYIHRDGKKISQFYLVEPIKKKVKLKKRKCLQCGAMFRPTSRFNFLCGKDEVEY